MRQGSQGPGGRAGRRACRAALALALTGLSGCLSFVNPVPPPPPPTAELTHGIPAPARGHVYVFFINGLDPVNLGNLTGLRDYVQALGFPKTYYGQSYHGAWFAREIRSIRAEDPDARVALVGFSLGTNIGRGLAQSLRDEGIAINLLICLSSNNVIDFAHDRPENVGRYVDVLVHGRDLGPGDDPQTERHNLGGWVWHFGSPSHPETLDVVARELTALAMGVPLAEPPPPPPPPFAPPESLPAPRLLPPQGEGEPAEGWQLLAPTASLREPPSLELPPPGPAAADQDEATPPAAGPAAPHTRRPRGGARPADGRHGTSH
jgi:hypothetical protein